LSIDVAESTDAAMVLLNASICAGGPDGRYTAAMTASNTLGFSDLRPYSVPADFLGQAVHTTLAPNYYNDTIDLAVAANKETGGSTIVAFSLSLIGGAYCDDGQNYFNIMQLIESIPWSSGFTGGEQGIDGSCPAAALSKKKSHLRS
jgi:hypothetical protein